MSSSVDDRASTHHEDHSPTDKTKHETADAVETETDQISSQPTEKDGNEETTDLDALIDELDDDEKQEDERPKENDQVLGAAKTAPEEMLQTNQYAGLTDAEVQERKKRYGLNEMKEEKENLLKKFLMFFVGPIQFVMQVSQPTDHRKMMDN